MRRRNSYRSRIRKESRTIPLYGNPDRGNGLDEGRYFRCWNCNSICNIDRDALGGPESRDGITYEDFPIPFDASLNNISRLGGSIGPSAVSPALDSAGDTTTDKNHRKPVVNTGCWFCGSLNWKGDY